ncbi:conserved hypothetical protein [Alphaproteobacteria bacterium]
MTISIEEWDFFRDKYDDFNCLLGYLHTYSYPDYGSDQKIIEHYVEVFCKEDLESTIKQGREVLALEPFPHEWVYNAVEWRSLDCVPGDTLEEKYYNWVKWLLEVLEAEARRAGKL